MKTYLECIPCFMNQALRAGRMATNDEKIIKAVLDETGDLIKNIPMQNTPAETGMLVYNIVKKHTGVYDPYAAIKARHIEEAKAIFPELVEIVNRSEDKLLTAIRIAIAGNVIDLGINKSFDIVSDVKEILTKEFAVFDYDGFKNQLAKAKYVLYLADNAGESVFDKILIQQLNKPVYYAVRSKPVINDVTKDDAIASGIDQVAEIVDSGSEAPGTILDMCNAGFRKLFDNAGLVISKGQGNYEGLSTCNRQVFFLLKAKCKVISDHLSVKEGGIVLKEHKI
jgi:uncharacterized protein with ATP-grasp and redox domains